MSPGIPDTPIGLAFGIFFLLAQLADRAIRGLLWRHYQALRAAHVATLTSAPENVRPLIEEHEPDPPPGFGPLAVVLAAGALAGLVAGAARGELQLARRLVMQDELAAAAPALRCVKDGDCSPGHCDRGQCAPPADKPKPPVPHERRRPRSVAEDEGVETSELQLPPWQDRSIQAFPVRAPGI